MTFDDPRRGGVRNFKYHESMVKAMRAKFRQLSWLHKSERAGMAHRLDVETSGCILVGLNERAFKELRHQIDTHQCYKEYVALCYQSGIYDSEG